MSEEASDTSHEETENIPLLSDDIEIKDHIKKTISLRTSTNKNDVTNNTIRAKSCCAPPRKNETFNNIWIFDKSLRLQLIF